MTAPVFLEKLRNQLYAPATRAQVPYLLSRAAQGDFRGFTQGREWPRVRRRPLPVDHLRRILRADGCRCRHCRGQRHALSAPIASNASAMPASNGPQGAADPRLMRRAGLPAFPVLFIAGEQDPVTPADWAARGRQSTSRMAGWSAYRMARMCSMASPVSTPASTRSCSAFSIAVPLGHSIPPVSRKCCPPHLEPHLEQTLRPAALARLPRARHLRRTLLRPGVRVRGHTALAHAGRTHDAGRRAADAVPVAGRVVGVDVHLLVHQLDRSRQAIRTHSHVLADARGPADVGRDSQCLRPRGIAVRDRVRVHPGSSVGFHGVRDAWP